jgi:hypothetical protein
MVGYHTARDSAAIGGPSRVRLLSALVEGYLTPSLATTRYFRALEPSERVSMTFLLAQAFTHWAADAHMRVPVLLHVSGSSISYSVAATTSPGKPGAGPQKNKSRPDFFGIAPGEVHVFESKGRSLPSGSTSLSKTLANAILPAALAQVSRVATANGLVPKTRTAAVWIFRQGGSSGFVQDPPSTGVTYDVSFDVAAALLRYYKLALEASMLPQVSHLSHYMRMPLDDRRTLFIDREVWDALKLLERHEVSADQFLKLLGARRERFERARRLLKKFSTIALGLDGVGLIATTDEKTWQSQIDEDEAESGEQSA